MLRAQVHIACHDRVGIRVANFHFTRPAYPKTHGSTSNDNGHSEKGESPENSSNSSAAFAGKT